AVLGRTRSVNDGRIDDGAGGNLDAAALQVKVDRLQHGSAQLVLFEKVAEFADGGFVGHRLVAKINLSEAAHQRRVVQRFLPRRVGEAEPLLKKVNSQHALDTHGTASIARL